MTWLGPTSDQEYITGRIYHELLLQEYFLFFQYLLIIDFETGKNRLIRNVKILLLS